MDELIQPIIVDLPLRGEWSCPNTPGAKVPSHGTDQFAQRYAYDFMMVDWNRKEQVFFEGSAWRYFLLGVPLNKCLGWGKPVYAPCDGEILTVADGYKERQPVHLVRDLLIAWKNAFTFNPEKVGLQPVAGNHIIMRIGSIYALFAHLQRGSICVAEGQQVNKGDVLGRVGHSGNSTAPHLHFQLMDSPDPLTAKGLPCAFSRYELFENGAWKPVQAGIPTDKDRFRLLEQKGG